MVKRSAVKKKRILWLSDSPTVNSGFGVVAKNLIDNITKIMGGAIEIVVIGINIGKEQQPIKYNAHTTIINGVTDHQGRTDVFCRGAFLDMLTNVDFDGIFILQDHAIVIQMLANLKAIKAGKMKANRKSFKSIIYMPVDGYIPKGMLEGMDFFDLIIAYNEYGKKMIAANTPALMKKIRIIPHGCNTTDFYPIPKDEIREFRESFFGEGSDRKIIFVNVNRNQPRKAIHDTVFSFIEMRELWFQQEPESDRRPFLYLNMGRRDPMGMKLSVLFEQTNLKEGVDYMIAPEEFWVQKWGCDTDVLNKIYNACDVFITTTLGEGWGLSVTEAMAVGLPVICPYHTSLKEISGGRLNRAFTLVELTPTVVHMDGSVIREQIDHFEAAELMVDVANRVINGDDLLKGIVDRAKSYAKFSLSWYAIAGHFVKYFDEVF